MSTTDLRKKDHNLITCPLCDKIYDSPKILPCLHSFCEQCLNSETTTIQKFATAALQTCPVCESPVQIPHCGTHSLKTNTFLKSLTELLRSDDTRSCDVCQEKETAVRCVDCFQNLCKCCLEVHSKITVTQHHRVLNMGDYEQLKDERQIRSLARPKFCSRHIQSKLNLLCVSCKVCVCHECVITEHCIPEHTIKYAEDIANEFREKTSDVLEIVKAKEDEIKETLLFTEGMRDEMKEIMTEEAAKITERAEDQIQKIQEEKNRLLSTLKMEYELQEGELDRRIERMRKLQIELSHALFYTETLVRHGDSVDALSQETMIMLQLEKLMILESRQKIVSVYKFVPMLDYGFMGTLKREMRQQNPNHKNKFL